MGSVPTKPRLALQSYPSTEPRYSVPFRWSEPDWQHLTNSLSQMLSNDDLQSNACTSSITQNADCADSDTDSNCSCSVAADDASEDGEGNVQDLTVDTETCLKAGASKHYEFVDFDPKAIEYVGRRIQSPRKAAAYMAVGREQNLGFKLVKSDTKLIKTLLHAYGFTQCSARNPSFNILWTSAHLKPHVLRNLHPWQRVNHFPRSSELSRKDRLYENIARARNQHGAAYDFIPEFYVTPRDHDRLSAAMLALQKSQENNGHPPFIVKPVSSSQGKGIYLASKPDDIGLASNLLVSRYISNPLLINGHKFDLRVYVAVTSFHPLICYVYSEGLTRFASEKYQLATRPGDECVHLTNYSVNKHSSTFVRNDTFSSEDFGHKWTLGALLRHLEKEGMDARLLMLRIEDLVIKTLLSTQSAIGAVCRNTLIFPNMCFELFGFDVLVDSKMRPWLLEVNLSPSLTCDAPLDSVVKTRLICDLFNMACIPIIDRKAPRNNHGSGESSPVYVSPRILSARASKRPRLNVCKGSSSEQRARVYVRKLRLEGARCGGFVRVFPRKRSFPLYGPIMDNVGAEKWDAKLYRSVFGTSEDEEHDDESDSEAGDSADETNSTLYARVHEQLMMCERHPTVASLSPDVAEMLDPWLASTSEYLQKITKEGEKYMARLPSVRSSARLRTKSCAEFYELRAARLNDDNMSDMVVNKAKDSDSGISVSDGKENAVPAVSQFITNDLSAGIADGQAANIVRMMSAVEIDSLRSHYLEKLLFEGLLAQVEKRSKYRGSGAALNALGLLKGDAPNERVIQSKVKYLLWNRQPASIRDKVRRLQRLSLRESEILLREVDRQRRYNPRNSSHPN